MDDTRRCTGTSKQSGQRCGRAAIPGGTVCNFHGGANPAVQQKARERLLEAVDPVMSRLLHLALHAESEQVSLAACRDALDRAGYGAKQLIDQTVTVSGDGETDASIRRLLDEMAARAQAGAAVAATGPSEPAGT